MPSSFVASELSGVSPGAQFEQSSSGRPAIFPFSGCQWYSFAVCIRSYISGGKSSTWKSSTLFLACISATAFLSTGSIRCCRLRNGAVRCIARNSGATSITAPFHRFPRFPGFFRFRGSLLNQYSVYSGEVYSRLCLHFIMVIYERLKRSEFAHVFCVTPHSFLWQLEIVRVA